MELLETLLHSFVNLAMLLFEYIGVGVITYAGIQGLVNYMRKAPDTRLVLAQGLAMGLEFKLGSEILRTVVVRSLSEIAIVGSIIYKACVSIALNLGGQFRVGDYLITIPILIHWEIKNEVNEKQVPEAAQAAAAEDTAVIPTTSKNDSDHDTAGKTAIAKTENVIPIENKELTASAENADADTANDSSDSRPSSLQD